MRVGIVLNTCVGGVCWDAKVCEASWHAESMGTHSKLGKYPDSLWLYVMRDVPVLVVSGQSLHSSLLRYMQVPGGSL